MGESKGEHIKPRRVKRIKYTILGEDWGDMEEDKLEDEVREQQEEQFDVLCTPRYNTTLLTTTVITDYFTTTMKTVKKNQVEVEQLPEMEEVD